MNTGELATVIMAAIACLSLFGGGLVLIYKRGGEERAITDRVRLLGDSFDKLEVVLRDNTASNEGLREELRDFKLETLKQYHEMDIRLTKLETKE